MIKPCLTHAANTVSTYAGICASSGWVDAAFLSAKFNSPRWLVCNPFTAELYVSDTGNTRIRAINDTAVYTLAGSGNTGTVGGPNRNAAVRVTHARITVFGMTCLHVAYMFLSLSITVCFIMAVPHQCCVKYVAVQRA